MSLTLTIENVPNLPDGGPVTVTVRGERGIDIGRSPSLDWTLPDPSRTISSKHCEVRWRDGGYWLVDVSTNGTFLNGADHRMTAPHRLHDGDRLGIGPYLIGVAIDGPESQSRPPLPSARSSGDPWASEGEAPPPIDPRQLRAQPPRPAGSDFLDWVADAPPAAPARPLPRAAARWEDDSAGWAGAAPSPGFPEPPPFDTSGAAPATGAIAPNTETSGWIEPPAQRPKPRRSAPLDAPAQEDSPFMPPAQGELSAAAAPPARLIERPELADDPFAAALDQQNRRASAGADHSPREATGGLDRAGAYAAPPPARPAPPRRGEPAVAAPSVAARAGGAATPDTAPGAGSEAFLRRAAQAAGLPEDAFSQRGWEQLADEWGGLLREITQDVMQLMQARFEARRIARSSHQTTIQALDNNPLKFSPTPEEALRIMFGAPTRSYLGATRAFGASFDDLKRHHLVTFQAMQEAMKRMMEDMAPEAIESSLGDDRGLAAMLGSRKARAWDIYAARWNAKTMREDDGMLGAFMRYFAQAYDDIDRKA